MEGDVAAVLVALDTSTNLFIENQSRKKNTFKSKHNFTDPSLPTHPTCELPSGRWYVPDAVDGLKEDRVGKTHFWDPKATYHVSPSGGRISSQQYK